MNKDNIYTEIRQAVKFLLREREKGREKFEIEDLYNTELEDQLLINYENKITRDEYEKVVSDLFGKAPLKSKKLPINRVKKETEKLIKQYRMKSKKQIYQKLWDTFTPHSENVELMKKIMEEVYHSIMKDAVTKRIQDLVKSGTTDPRRLLGVLSRDGYEMSPEFSLSVLKKELDSKTNKKLKYSRGRRTPTADKTDTAKSDSLKKERMRNQMKKSLMQKTRFNKRKFLKKECLDFKFVQVSDSIENDMRALIHLGQKDNVSITIKSLMQNERVTDLQVSITKGKSKKTAAINVNEYAKVLVDSSGSEMLQNWLKSTNFHMKYNTQELIWFVTNTFNTKFGLPESTTRHLNSSLIKGLSDMEKTLTEFVIKKALESV